MGTMKGYKYNGAIDRVKIKPGEKYSVNDGQGLLFQHDIFDDIPAEYYAADYVVVDPPWNRGNLSSFYTKAEKTLDKDFEQFLNRIFEVIKAIGVNSCYMEFGFQFKDEIVKRMTQVFDNVRVVESLYYKKNPCYFIIGENEGHDLDFDTTRRDELLVIEEIIRLKPGKVIDFCLGRGAVSRSALKHGKSFIGTELNINRLAVAYEDLTKAGAVIKRI